MAHWEGEGQGEKKESFWGEEGLNVRLAPLGSKLSSHCTSSPIVAIEQSREKKGLTPAG